MRGLSSPGSWTLCTIAGPQGLVIGPEDGLLYVTIRSFPHFSVRLITHSQQLILYELVP